MYVQKTMHTSPPIKLKGHQQAETSASQFNTLLERNTKSIVLLTTMESKNQILDALAIHPREL